MLKSPASKGRRAEHKVAKMIREAGFEARRMVMSGAMDYLPTDIWSPDFNYAVEVKHHERIRIWDFIEQCENQAPKHKMPLLVFTSNNRPFYATLKLEDFLQLTKELKELRGMHYDK